MSTERESILVPRHLLRHIAWCEQRNLRPTYIATRRRQLVLLSREIGKPLEDATAGDLEVWYAELATRIEPAAYAGYLSHAGSYYKWLIRQGLRADDPTESLSPPRLHARLPRPIGDHDLIPALADPPDRLRQWMLLGVLAGFRACECANLRGEDINWQHEKILITDGKGGKQRVVPMHPVVGDEFASLPRHGWLFPHTSRFGPVRPWTVSHHVNDYLHRLGIAATFHQFRHRFGTDLYRATKDLVLVGELMGHVDPATTRGYIQWDRETATAAVRALSLPVAV